MKSFLKKQWFLFVLLCVVAFGCLVPGPGVYIKDELGLNFFIFIMLFLMSFTLRTQQIWAAVTNYKGLAIALTTGYAVVGGMNFLAAKLLFSGRPDLFVGLVVVGAVPCTLVSAAVWTRLAGGNDALALSTTIASNGINFLVAPVMLNLMLAGYLAGRVELPVSMMAWKIFLVVLLPVTLGQLARAPRWSGEFADRVKKPVSVIGRLIILTVVLVAGSKVGKQFAGHGAAAIGIGAIAMLEAAIAVSHVSALLAAYFLMKLVRAEAGDCTAAAFAGSQKTLPLAIWLVENFFGSGDLAFAVLPALLYHATQLMIDSALMGYLSPGGKGEGVKDAPAPAPPSPPAPPAASA